MPAAGTFIEMTAENGGATPRDGQQHFDMLPADPLTASFDECASRSADQIGHLQRWPVHLLVAKTPARREINNIGAAISPPFCYKS